MSDTLENLRRKLDGAAELVSVVRTMKALAASSITQYERAVTALDDYYRTVELGLTACLNQAGAAKFAEKSPTGNEILVAVVFGSDQGLVGQFNEVLADFTVGALGSMQGSKHIWAVGERVEGNMADALLHVAENFPVPNSVTAITPLVGRILIGIDALRNRGEEIQVYLFHNQAKAGGLYEPVLQRLLPLDESWQHRLSVQPWPTIILPEVLAGSVSTLHALIREYLFISLFRACAESLACENASRLAAMQRAEKNIDELLAALNQAFHRHRQSAIDEELFDVVSGFEALTASSKGKQAFQRE
jgi:F-type H+-transporting ATPase subunit gamma